jgi:hypothetical protein
MRKTIVIMTSADTSSLLSRLMRLLYCWNS